jgi:hypothetical protein
VSSFKLQPCLELCRFTQAPLKIKVVRWKAQFLLGNCEKTLCNIHWNGWHITWGTQSERKLLRLESHSYCKSHLSHKAYCFAKIIDKKPFLVCFEALLDFPKQCRISPSPNQVYALIHIYHWVILHRFLCSPSYCNLGMRFLLGGRLYTLCYSFC